MQTPILQGFNENLDPTHRHAVELLSHLPLADFNRLAQIMEVESLGILTPNLIERFLKLLANIKIDVSDDGVNTFKKAHNLGNTGLVQGVIGPQTADLYYSEILHRLNSVPAANSGQSPKSHINDEGLALIKEFEGLARLTPGVPNQVNAYLDSVGVPTIGYGHTKGVHIGQRVSVAQAEQFLRDDLNFFESGVTSLSKVPLTSNQFSALVSLAFNVGLGAVRQSSLLVALNARQYDDAADRFLRFSFAGGHRLAGLLRRRQAERALFLK